MPCSAKSRGRTTSRSWYGALHGGSRPTPRHSEALEKYLQRTNIRVVWILYYTMYQNAARRNPSDHWMTGFHALFGLGLPSGNSIKEIIL